MAWLATPPVLRVPLYQGQFAKQIGVHETTLSDWKKLEGWQEEVDALIRATLGEALPGAVKALKDKAQAGEFQHLKMYLEMMGWYTEKSDNKNENTTRIIVEYADTQSGPT